MSYVHLNFVLLLRLLKLSNSWNVTFKVVQSVSTDTFLKSNILKQFKFNI